MAASSRDKANLATKLDMCPTQAGCTVKLRNTQLMLSLMNRSILNCSKCYQVIMVLLFISPSLIYDIIIRWTWWTAVCSSAVISHDFWELKLIVLSVQGYVFDLCGPFFLCRIGKHTARWAVLIWAHRFVLKVNSYFRNKGYHNDIT